MNLGKYRELFRALLDHRLTADAFCEEFLKMWRDDRDSALSPGDVVDNVMTAVDCYEPGLHPGPFDITEQQLRTEVRKALDLLAAE